MKLRDVIGGHRAIERVLLPLVNRPSPLSAPVPELDLQRANDAAERAEAGLTPEEPSVEVGLRVLTGLEWTAVHERASDFARARKVPEDQLNDRNSIYNLGCSVYTCALACVDPDTSAKDPDPFFGERGDIESAALELLSSPHIGRDGILFLAEAQALWQDRCSPSALRVSPDKMLEIVAELASADEERAASTFLGLRPGMRWSSLRFMAIQLRSLPMLSSLYSGSTPAKTSESAPS